MFDWREAVKRAKFSYRTEAIHGEPCSDHRHRFSQDYHDENGRLIHAEWDGYFWQLFDANTSDFISLWDKKQLPAQPGELVFPPPSEPGKD